MSNFKRDFIDIDFDRLLDDVCDVSSLSNRCYLDYTEYKLNYMLETQKNYDFYKKAEANVTNYKTTLKTGDVLYSFTNYTRDNKVYKDILLRQRRLFENFTEFIKSVPILNSRYTLR
jgi:hypothetical protein